MVETLGRAPHSGPYLHVLLCKPFSELPQGQRNAVCTNAERNPVGMLCAFIKPMAGTLISQLRDQLSCYLQSQKLS